MSTFLRIFQHLLPRGRAWSIVVDKPLRRLMAALAESLDDAATYAQQLWTDYPAATTQKLAAWVAEYGLLEQTEEDQRLALSAARKATGGQGPEYLQGLLQAAGFDVYVHGPWLPATLPREARDPRDWLNDILIGLTQCGDPIAQCGHPDAVCDGTLLRRAGYLVNKDLTSRAGPALPSDPAAWGNFIYVGGATFGDRVDVLESRREEFERLILTYFPADPWIGLFIDYIAPPLPAGYIIDWNADTYFASTDYPSGTATVAAGPGTSIAGEKFGNAVLARTDWGDGTLAFYKDSSANPCGIRNTSLPNTASGQCDAYTVIAVAKMSTSTGSNGELLISGNTVVKGRFIYRASNVQSMTRSSNNADSPTQLAAGTPFILCARFSTTSAAVNPGRMDATIRRKSGADITWGADSFMAGPIAGASFGADGGGTSQWRRQFKRYLYWPRILTPEEIAYVLDVLEVQYLDPIS